MKTLNRPMFRYGGPIKEGIMDGIRENKRHGGSMGNNQGPRRAALVGDPNFPQTDGRAHHVAPIVYGLGTAAMAAGRAGLRYIPRAIQAGKRAFGKTTPASVTRGTELSAKKAAKEFGKGSGKATSITMNPSKFDANYLGRDPLIKSVGAIGKGIFSPTSKGVVAKAARFATAPSSIVAGVAYYMWPDGEERKTPPPKKGGVNTPSGNNPFGYEDDKNLEAQLDKKELTKAEKKALEAKNRMEQMDSFKEIMDIKGMNKNAAYKSLIDASKIIGEGGNLKEQFKSGNLIQKVTEAASKRFDKVGDTETALRSLVAKGEIQNILDKDKNALDKEYKQSALDINKKKLAGATLAEELSAYRTKNDKNASGRKLAGFLIDKGNDVIDIADTVKVDEHIKSGGNAVSFMEDIVLKNLEKGVQVTPGIYVVKDEIIVIDEKGNVTRTRP